MGPSTEMRQPGGCLVASLPGVPGTCPAAHAGLTPWGPTLSSGEGAAATVTSNCPGLLSAGGGPAAGLHGAHWMARDRWAGAPRSIDTGLEVSIRTGLPQLHWISRAGPDAEECKEGGCPEVTTPSILCVRLPPQLLEEPSEGDGGCGPCTQEKSICGGNVSVDGIFPGS